MDCKPTSRLYYVHSNEVHISCKEEEMETYKERIQSSLSNTQQKVHVSDLIKAPRSMKGTNIAEPVIAIAKITATNGKDSLQSCHEIKLHQKSATENTYLRKLENQMLQEATVEIDLMELENMLEVLNRLAQFLNLNIAVQSDNQFCKISGGWQEISIMKEMIQEKLDEINTDVDIKCIDANMKQEVDIKFAMSLASAGHFGNIDKIGNNRKAVHYDIGIFIYAFCSLRMELSNENVAFKFQANFSDASVTIESNHNNVLDKLNKKYQQLLMANKTIGIPSNYPCEYKQFLKELLLVRCFKPLWVISFAKNKHIFMVYAKTHADKAKEFIEQYIKVNKPLKSNLAYFVTKPSQNNRNKHFVNSNRNKWDSTLDFSSEVDNTAPSHENANEKLFRGICIKEDINEFYQMKNTEIATKASEIGVRIQLDEETPCIEVKSMDNDCVLQMLMFLENLHQNYFSDERNGKSVLRPSTTSAQNDADDNNESHYNTRPQPAPRTSRISLSDTSSYTTASENSLADDKYLTAGSSPDHFRDEQIKSFGTFAFRKQYGSETVISVEQQKITDVVVDAIVNITGERIDLNGEIVIAAGAEVARECEQFYYLWSGVPVVTLSGNLIKNNVQKIIHAVGPVWKNNFEYESRRQLTEAYYQCLLTVYDYRGKTVALQHTDQVRLGIPKDKAAACIVTAIGNFLSCHYGKYMEHIHLVDSHPEMMNYFIDILKRDKRFQKLYSMV